MDYNITTQTIEASRIMAALDDAFEAVTFIDDTYAVTITPTVTGFDVTDSTGGDMFAANIDDAFEAAAELIDNLLEDGSDNAADWRELVDLLR